MASNQILEAFRAGVEDRQREDRMVQEQENRDLQRKKLKWEMDRLKIQDVESKRKSNIEEALLQQRMQQGEAESRASFPTLTTGTTKSPEEAKSFYEDIGIPGPEQSAGLAPVQPNIIPGRNIEGFQIPGHMVPTNEQRFAQALQSARLKQIVDVKPEEFASSPLGIFSKKTGIVKTEAPPQELTLYQQEMLNMSRERLDMAKKNASVMGLPPAVISKADSLARSFDSHPVVKQFNETAARYEGLKLLVEGEWTGPADLAIVFEFMRALDPTSVVREKEYATAAKSGSIFKGWAARFNGQLRAEGGFLSEQVKKDFMNALDQKVSVVKGQTKNIYNDFSRRIDRITGQSGTGKDWLTDYTEMLPKASTETSAQPQGGDKPATMELNGKVYTLQPDGTYR